MEELLRQRNELNQEIQAQNVPGLCALTAGQGVEPGP